MALIKGIK